MTALCPALAYTYQTMCLGFNLDQLRPEAFRLPQPKKKFTMLPTCRTTTRMTGIQSPSWRLFSDEGFKRQVNFTEMSGWGIAAVSLDNFVRILCGPVQVLPKPLDGPIFEALLVNVCVSSMIPNTRPVLRLVLITQKRNIELARRCNELLVRLKCKFHLSVHHVFSHAGNAWNECADAASLGMRGFISEANVPLFGLKEVF